MEEVKEIVPGKKQRREGFKGDRGLFSVPPRKVAIWLSPTTLDMRMVECWKDTHLTHPPPFELWDLVCSGMAASKAI